MWAQTEQLTGEAQVIPYPSPQTHNPWHRRKQPWGCSIFPHGKEISSSPSPVDIKNTQDGSSALPQHQCPAPRCSPLPFPTLPIPAQHQVVGLGEPKPGCWQQNALEGWAQISLHSFQDCAKHLSVFQQKQKVSQPSIMLQPLLLSVRLKWQELSSFPPAGAGRWELAGLCHGADCQEGSTAE